MSTPIRALKEFTNQSQIYRPKLGQVNPGRKLADMPSSVPSYEGGRRKANFAVHHDDFSGRNGSRSGATAGVLGSKPLFA